MITNNNDLIFYKMVLRNTNNNIIVMIYVNKIMIMALQLNIETIIRFK